MTNITPEQARQRFKTLPSRLQEVIFSVQTAEAVERVKEQNQSSLPKEKAGAVGYVAGLVFLGFIKTDEMGKELQERTGIAAPLAKTISESLSNRLFPPVRAEIERAYSPLSGMGKPEVILGGTEMPRIIDEIKQLEKSGTELVEVLKKREGPEKIGGVGAPSLPAAPAFGPAAVRPIIKPPEIKPAAPPPPMAAPFILHEEASATPIASPGSGFKLDIPIRKFDEQKTSPVTAPGRAKIETWEPGKTAVGAPAKTNVVQPPRVINYGAPIMSANIPQAPMSKPMTGTTLNPPPAPMPAPKVTLPTMSRPEIGRGISPAPMLNKTEISPKTPVPVGLPPLPDRKNQEAQPVKDKKSVFGWLFGKKSGSGAGKEAPVRNISYTADSSTAAPARNLNAQSAVRPPVSPAPATGSQSPTPPSPVATPLNTPRITKPPVAPSVDAVLKGTSPAGSQGSKPSNEVIDLSSLTKIQK